MPMHAMPIPIYHYFPAIPTSYLANCILSNEPMYLPTCSHVHTRIIHLSIDSITVHNNLYFFFPFHI